MQHKLVYNKIIRVYTYKINQRKKMLKTIIAKISVLFQPKSYPPIHQSELEQYIISKNPQSIFDVEYWTHEFDKHGSKRGYK